MVGKPVVRCFVLGVAILLGSGTLQPGISETSQARFARDNLGLRWDSPGEGSPVEWNVNASLDQAGQDVVSLVSRSTEGERLSHHLQLTGIPINSPEWRVADSNPGSILLRARSADGRFELRKQFVSVNADWRLGLVIEIENLSDSPVESTDWDPGLTLGPGLGERPVKGLGIAETLYSFVEPVSSVSGQVVGHDIREAGETDTRLLEEGEPDWFGLHTRYFALLAAPRDGPGLSATTMNLPGPEESGALPPRFLPRMDLKLETSQIGAGETVRWEFGLFSGPKAIAALQGADAIGDFQGILFPNLWEWMRALCFALLWLLVAIHGVLPSWGLAIILLAVIVRLLMYPMAKRALASQKAFNEVQKKIQPEMAEIKKEYSGGEQSERILELYESHGVSPLAGLKPLLIVAIQIPIFVALFHVLGQAFELRDASFLWMETLAEPDRLIPLGVDLPFFGGYFNLMPFLMAFTTLLTIKLSPAPAADEKGKRRQTVFLVAMAMVFLLLFYPFPAGMVLYWTVANILHIAQQVFMGRGE